MNVETQVKPAAIEVPARAEQPSGRCRSREAGAQAEAAAHRADQDGLFRECRQGRDLCFA